MLKTYLRIQEALERLKDERGQDLVEYALVGSLVAVACVASVTGVATAVEGVFNTIANSI